jgi:hypothetical protein
LLITGVRGLLKWKRLQENAAGAQKGGGAAYYVTAGNVDDIRALKQKDRLAAMHHQGQP